jgi:N-acetylglucosamine-6-phosphate deacetylase
MHAYYNGRIFDGNTLRTNVAVLADKEQVIDIVPESAIPANATTIDLQNNFMAPAFIDLQIYGAHGKLFSQDLSVASLQETYNYCVAGGCRQFMITMATNSMSTFYKGMDVARTYWQQGGKGLLGLHLEGPYINPLKRGAHIEQYVKEPTIEEVTALLAYGKDVFKMMTLAPEKCAPAVLQLLSDTGIIISAGHSNATYEQATAAFNNGIPVATHLFNAMSPLQHRQPGLAGAIFDHTSAMSSIVADGIHVDFAAVRIAKKIMKERLFLITDAVAASSEGEYRHVFTGDRYTLPDGTLSGSALTMMKAVKNCVEQVGIDLEEALRMASLYPAKLAGLSTHTGKIAAGCAASFVIFNNNLEVVKIING